MLPTLLRRPVILAAATALAFSVAPATANAATGDFGYQGFAIGSKVTVGDLVVSDSTASVSFGCGTPAGFSRTNTSVGVNVPPNILQTGTIVTTGETSVSPTASNTSSTVQSVNALGGLVTASAVTAESTTSHNGSSFSTSAAGTSFANLRVAGLPVLLSPGPNTRLALPGVGRVVLNEQKREIGADTAFLSVIAIHIFVTETNLLGFEVGTNIVIGQAASALTAPSGGALAGYAYGTQIQAGTLLSSAPSFPVSLPCAGTNGQIVARQGAGVTIPPGVLNSGTIRNTVQGSTTDTTASAQSTSTVETVSLLNGLVQATGVRSVANANRVNGTTTLDSQGSTFATVTVDGQPLIVADIGPNTTINLVGVGTLSLRNEISNSTGIQVSAIVIRLSQPTLGLPTGTVIRVAVAAAAAS